MTVLAAKLERGDERIALNNRAQIAPSDARQEVASG